MHANEFAARASRAAGNYLTHTFGIDEVQAAFELACRPAPGPRQDRDRRMSADDAATAGRRLPPKTQIWGGWVVGPTMIGPEEFARAGLRLRRIRRAARLSRRRRRRAAPAPARTCADRAPLCDCRRPTPRRSAGCSTRAPTRSSSRWSSPPSRRPPRSPRPGTRRPECAASARCEPSLGHDPAALEVAGQRVRDGRDRSGACGRRRHLRRPAGLSGIYVGPADLAISMGYGLTEAMDAPGGARRDGTTSDVPRQQQGWSPASMPATGKLGKAVANWVFG